MHIFSKYPLFDGMGDAYFTQILRATLNVFVFAKCSKGYVYSKGQLISKADWCAMDELVLFASLLFTANKSNSSVGFWENLRLAYLLLDLILPLIKNFSEQPIENK